MPPSSYRERVEEILHTLAQAGEPCVDYERFIDKVVVLRRWHDEPVSPQKTKYIHNVLVREAKAHRLRFLSKGKVKVICLTPNGIARYLAWREPLRLGIRRRPLEKDVLVGQYRQLADAVYAIIEACQIASPRAYDWDIRNLPSLVRKNLNAIQYMSEINQDIIDRNDAVCERLHALDPTFPARHS
ncbi:hypothetical protein FKP32DRAFT_1671604 [Trametes sanguinea]|nr:hypothetical protein FKP32DRAFT_1671604 [Trametes sanguinea]